MCTSSAVTPRNATTTPLRSRAARACLVQPDSVSRERPPVEARGLMVEEVVYVDQRLVITGLQGETKGWNGMTHIERQKHCPWSVLCPTDQDAIVGDHVLATRIHGHGAHHRQAVVHT